MLKFAKKHILFFYLVVLIALVSCSCSQDQLLTESEPMPELVTPGYICADAKHLVIVDGRAGVDVCIYGRAELDRQLNFGEKGRGDGKLMALPGEPVRPYLLGDQILISSFGKLSAFDWQGRLLDEQRVNVETSNYQPLGDGFVAQGQVMEKLIAYTTLNLYDANRQFRKEILRLENAFQSGVGNRILTARLQYQTYGDQLYVIGRSEDFKLDIFDAAGELIRSTEVGYERIPFTVVHDREVHAYYKEHPNFREIYQMIVRYFIFPEQLPAIKEFVVADDKIYVWTYRVTRGLRELYVLSTHGTLEAVQHVPAGGHNLLASGLCTIQGGRQYQLVTSQIGNDWTLLVTTLN